MIAWVSLEWRVCALFLAMAVAALMPLRMAFAEEPRGSLAELTEIYEYSDNSGELSKTWELGYVFVPGSASRESIYGKIETTAVQTQLAKLPDELHLPVIVYLHDAGGVSKKINHLMKALEFENFAMIIPDSYARAGRRSDCQGNVANPKKCAMSPEVYLSRRSEMIHAVEAVRQLTWADQGNLFLMGTGEGAVAVALWGGEVEASGYILVDWTCTAPAELPWFDGLRTPTDRATLVLMPRDHRWADMPGWDGDCSGRARTHADFQMLNINSAIRNVFEVPEGMQATLRFLRVQKNEHLNH